MDARLAQVQGVFGGSSQLAGIGIVGGMPPTLGSAGGTPRIMNSQTPAVNKVLILWAGALAVLVLFHVGGARLG